MSNGIKPTDKAHGREWPDGTRTEWEASTRDDDNSTVFSWNPTSIPEFNRLYLDFAILNETTSGNDLQLTVNGITTQDYRYREETATDTTDMNTLSYWRLTNIQAGLNVDGQVRLLGRVRDAETIKPTADVSLGTYPIKPAMETGDLNSNVDAITSLTLDTTGNATGWAVLKGYAAKPI